MKPGPKIYYKCTKCGKITKRGSFLSANTCGSILYSDGKRVAPMYPVFPAIIKCKNCSTFYWLDKETKIGLECPEDWSKAYYSKNENEIYTKYPEAYSAEFLSVDEYNEAISSKVYRNEDELKFLRIRLWWAFNDRIRKDYIRPYLNREKGNIFLSEKDQKIYEDNCLELINILNTEDLYEKVKTAELYRNLGNFDESRKVLKTLGKEYIWLKEQLAKECSKSNKYLIAIKQIIKSIKVHGESRMVINGHKFQEEI